MANNLEQYINNPNVRRMLDLISATEKANYDTIFGGRQLNNYADHPRKLFSFTNTKGKKQKSSAAGRYQFIQDTWDEVAKKLGLKDFSPRNQDLAAIYLMQRRGALDDVLRGDFEKAIAPLGAEWASLPSSNYAQPKRSMAFVNSQLGKNEISKAPPVGIPQASPENIESPTQTSYLASAFNPSSPNYSPQLGKALPNSLYSALTSGINPDESLGLNQELNTPDWRNNLPTASQELSSNQPDNIFQTMTGDWQDQLIRNSIARDGDNARNKAVSALLGDDYVPQLDLPSVFDRTINKITAGL